MEDFYERKARAEHRTKIIASILAAITTIIVMAILLGLLGKFLGVGT